MNGRATLSQVINLPIAFLVVTSYACAIVLVFLNKWESDNIYWEYVPGTLTEWLNVPRMTNKLLNPELFNSVFSDHVELSAFAFY